MKLLAPKFIFIPIIVSFEHSEPISAYGAGQVALIADLASVSMLRQLAGQVSSICFGLSQHQARPLTRIL